MSLVSKIHLADNEDIVDVIRRYGPTLFWHYFFAMVIMLSTAFFMFWLLAAGWWGYMIFISAMLFGAFIIFRAWFFNSKNLMVITTRRIVDVNRLGWLEEIVSSVGLADVKDVFYRKKGLGAGLLDYGDLTVETKSQQTILTMEKVRWPQKWQALITKTLDNFKDVRRLSNRQLIYAAFIKIVHDLSEAEISEIKRLLENRLYYLDTLEKDNVEVL